MNLAREIRPDLYWVGVNDRRLALFENVYPVPRGVSYNAYLLLDEKTVLMDTADRSVVQQFWDNVEGTLNGRGLDYLVVSHMEPDHCAVIGELLDRHPETQVVCNQKTVAMIGQFFGLSLERRLVLVKEGDTLSVGRHPLNFVMAPMVHWPEVMVTYDSVDGILFSADAFGAFGAMEGAMFADQVDYPRDWLDEARRYYTNIVGKYGAQVQALLKKAEALDVRLLCPLHGLVWRDQEQIRWLMDKYRLWSSYTPEEQGVLLVYASVYGHTEAAAELLANRLAQRGITRVAIYDVSRTDIDVLIGQAFRYSHLVLASVTYNNSLFSKMEHFLQELAAHGLQNRTVALLQNGSWAPVSAKCMSEQLAGLKNTRILEETVTLKSALKEEQLEQLERLAQAIQESMS